MSLHDALLRRGVEDPERVAILVGGDEWTYGHLVARTRALAAHLTSVGVRPGDRVAVVLPNRAEFILSVHAIWMLSGSVVLISPAWKRVELEHALSLTDARWAIVDGTTREVVELLGLTEVIDVDEIAGDAPAPDHDGPTPADLDDAVLVFSSGTTGLPKAVRHTHASLGFATGQWVTALGLGPEDRFGVSTPPSHILGLLNLLAAIDAGALVRLHRRFDLEQSLGSIEADRMTIELAVAPIVLAMANHPDLESFDLSSLRFILWGATPVTDSVARTVTARTGVGIVPGYGASELPVIAVNPVDEPHRWRLDAAGLPALGVELRVVDLESGAVLRPGEVGEILARGPALMAGYLPPEATDEAMVDGWYRTGDVGWMESDGWVHLTDRSKEMIKVNGFQVAPAEIEAVLHAHPDVLDCAVFGVPDAQTGEAPVAAVEIDPGADVDLDELKTLVSTRLATYKQLGDVWVVEQIPRLPSGKVLRRDLRRDWLTRPER